MKTTLTYLLSFAALVALAGPLMAEDSDPGSKQDRKVYNQLIQEIRTAHVNLARAYKKAVDEARSNNGQATTQTRASIVSFRDEIDRKNVRLMLVADRHGWEVPEFRLEDFEDQAKEPSAKSLTDQFFPPDPRITRVLAVEAKQLASQVNLPIIPAAAKVQMPAKSRD
jgi:hypothetical protein